MQKLLPVVNPEHTVFGFRLLSLSGVLEAKCVSDIQIKA